MIADRKQKAKAAKEAKLRAAEEQRAWAAKLAAVREERERIATAKATAIARQLELDRKRQANSQADNLNSWVEVEDEGADGAYDFEDRPFGTSGPVRIPPPTQHRTTSPALAPAAATRTAPLLEAPLSFRRAAQ